MIKKYDMLVSFQFTGTNAEQREKTLRPILNDLQAQGLTYFCSNETEDFFQQNNIDAEQIYEYCLAQQELCTEVLFVFADAPISTGMEKELIKAKQLNQPATVIDTTEQDFDWLEPFCVYAEGNPTQLI